MERGGGEGEEGEKGAVSLYHVYNIFLSQGKGFDFNDGEEGAGTHLLNPSF